MLICIYFEEMLWLFVDLDVGYVLVLSICDSNVVGSWSVCGCVNVEGLLYGMM